MKGNPSVTGIRAFGMNIALAKASKLSELQAQEIYRVMQLIATKGSFEGLPGAAVQSAMDFNHFPEAWKVVAKKALVLRAQYR
jgi:hypothetical protein